MKKTTISILFVLGFISCAKDHIPTEVLPSTDACNNKTEIAYEGKTYSISAIGTQCWMTENLNIGIMLGSTAPATQNNLIEKYCYDDDSSNCLKYGALYSWDEAMLYNENVSSGICPYGWHIPSTDEWYILENEITTSGLLNDSCCSAAKALASCCDWKDSSCKGSPGCNQNCNGLARIIIFPGGHLNLHNSDFYGSHIGSYHWASDTAEIFKNKLIHLSYDYNEIFYGQTRPHYAFSVLCVKD